MLRILSSVLVAASVAWAQGPMLRLERLPGSIRVLVDGKLFTVYHYDKHSRPYFYPILLASGRAMTRRYPLEKAAAGEAQDHSHHKGMFYAHGDVNGTDLWHDTAKNMGYIVQEEILEASSGRVGVLCTRNRYEDRKRKFICQEWRTMRFFANEKGRFLDFEVRIVASKGPVRMGDTKEGTMAIRLPATLRLAGKVAKGRAVSSEGVEGAAGWGRRARWLDYHGPVDGKVVGVAIFDHPKNHAHPTRWVVRDYGLFTANPFGLSYFEKQPKGSGDLLIPEGSEQSFRYRFYFHAGNPTAAGVEERYQEYVAQRRSIPPGYGLLYAQDFEKPEALADFVPSDAKAWRVGEAVVGRHSLELFGASQYKPEHRSPRNLALIAGAMFGDFVLEADLMQTGRDYGHRDLCLFFGFVDPSHFYYVHLATKADQHAHNIFVVDGSPRQRFAAKTTEGVDWGRNAWHRVRLERRLSDGRIRVYFDDMQNPIMEAKDRRFGWGYVGLGSFDDTGKVDNIRINGPSKRAAVFAGFER